MKPTDYNSPDLEPDQVLAYLTLGYRTPQNEREEKLLKEIKEIGEKGYEIEIPFNGI